MRVPVNEHAVVFVSFDEPNCERHWADLSRKCPWAVRVHGAKGVLRAYRQAACIVDTEHLILVDGDNVVRREFFESELEEGLLNEPAFVSWPGKNEVNGTIHGNGGVKCCPTRLLLESRAHDLGARRAMPVDPLGAYEFFLMNETWSTAHINGSPYQAFRSGFRAAVKLLHEHDRPIALEEIRRGRHKEIIERLLIWGSVGADVSNGLWVIYGSRRACHMFARGGWDRKLLHDYDSLFDIWDDSLREDFSTHAATQSTAKEIEVGFVLDRVRRLGGSLSQQLGLSFSDLGPKESRFFKMVYTDPPHMAPPRIVRTTPLDDGSLIRSLQARIYLLTSQLDALGKETEELSAKNQQEEKKRLQLYGERDALRRQVDRLTTQILAQVPNSGVHETAVTEKEDRSTKESVLARFARGRFARAAAATKPRTGRPDTPRPTTAVILTECDSETLQKCLDRAAALSRKRSVSLIAITDSDQFQLFKERNVPFEYVPPKSDRLAYAPRLDWDFYIGRRLQTIKQKWSPRTVIPMTKGANEVLGIWRRLSSQIVFGASP